MSHDLTDYQIWEDSSSIKSYEQFMYKHLESAVLANTVTA